MTRTAIATLGVSPPRPEIERELYEALKWFVDCVPTDSTKAREAPAFIAATAALKAYEATQ